jgi:hypothetical protein
MPETDPKGERGGDTGKTDQKGKGAGAEKGDQRRENPQHGGQTRNSPGARRGQNDEQPGHRNS